MAKKTYYVDRKVTVYMRDTYEFDLPENEVIKSLKSEIKSGFEYEKWFVWTEVLFDTEQSIDVLDNNGIPTIQVLRGSDNTTLATN